MGSTLSSYTYKRGRGARKIFGSKQGIVPLWNILPNLAVFDFLIWQVITSLYSAKSKVIPLPHLTFCKAIALHNVSYYTHIHIIWSL